MFEIKHGLMKRDSLDESFELIDPDNYFSDEEVLIAIDSDTLISIQILVKSILNNDFKKWKEIDNGDINVLSNIFLKLGYKKEEIANILSSL
ncbi:MAG: hypothetical protein LBR15_09070 [Methanobrevibacter sp.]|jgi:hypothetical protein|nr:hypothetical protein [Candidatus Methanovirga australis]